MTKNVTPEYAAAFIVETFRAARDAEWSALCRLRERHANTEKAWDRYNAASACVDALQAYAEIVAKP
jgi:hypothetical protein